MARKDKDGRESIVWHTGTEPYETDRLWDLHEEGWEMFSKQGACLRFSLSGIRWEILGPDPSTSAAADEMVRLLSEETTTTDIRASVGLSKQSASLGLTLAG